MNETDLKTALREIVASVQEPPTRSLSAAMAAVAALLEEPVAAVTEPAAAPTTEA